VAGSFNAYLSLTPIHKNHFKDSPDLYTTFKKLIIDNQIQSGLNNTECTYEADFLDGGVIVRYVSVSTGVQVKTLIEKNYLIEPDAPCARSEIKLLTTEDKNDYFHAMVFDQNNFILANNTLVYNREGKLFPFLFTQKHLCPLPLHDVEICEVLDTRSGRCLRFGVELGPLQEPAIVKLVWQNHGVDLKWEFTCDSRSRHAFYDMPLDDNPLLTAGDWSLAAVDTNERLLAQALVTLQPKFEQCKNLQTAALGQLMKT
jgi:hypothetical protein